MHVGFETSLVCSIFQMTGLWLVSSHDFSVTGKANVRIRQKQHFGGMELSLLVSACTVWSYNPVQIDGKF